MYCIVNIKGHQYKVSPGDLIDVQKLNSAPGPVEFNEVYFVGGIDNPKIGFPVVEGAKVKCEHLRNAKSRKVLVYKKVPGHRGIKRGHRQEYSALKVESIEV